MILQLIKICKLNFDREFNLLSRIKDGKMYYSILMDSKAIYNFLRDVFKIPPGKKSHVVRVPECIRSSNKEVKYAFLHGIMATEGGKRKRGYGMSTASITLWMDLVHLFNDVGIVVKTDRWVHQTYKKEYYGLYFRTEDYSLLLSRGCRSGQTGLA